MNNKKISVIIPVCNNLANLQNALALLRICSIDYIREIIVVDNNSDVSVREWLQIQSDIELLTKFFNITGDCSLGEVCIVMFFQPVTDLC